MARDRCSASMRPSKSAEKKYWNGVSGMGRLSMRDMFSPLSANDASTRTSAPTSFLTVKTTVALLGVASGVSVRERIRKRVVFALLVCMFFASTISPKLRAASSLAIAAYDRSPCAATSARKSPCFPMA